MTSLRPGFLASVSAAIVIALAGCPKDDDTTAGGSDGGGSQVAGQSGGGGGDSGSTGGDSGAGESGASGSGEHVDGGVVAADGGGSGELDAATSGGGSGCDLTCEKYQHCELVQPQCITTPCPPHAECVDNDFCGGIAAFPCPGAATCEDDPRDSCDPNNGGADCGGICVCLGPAPCPSAAVWNAAKCACQDDPCAVVKCASGTHCEAAAGKATCVADADGVPCGTSTCTGGDVCCNESCGICAPPDGACTQQFCG